MAIIIGAAVGGGIGLLLCIALFVCLLKRNKNDPAPPQVPNDGNEMQHVVAVPASSIYDAPRRRSSASYDVVPPQGEYEQLRLSDTHTDGNGSVARYVTFNSGEDTSAGAREFY